MVIDTSAIVAMISAEPEREQFLDVCLRSEASLLSAAGYLEAAIVLDKKSDPVLAAQLDELLQRLTVRIVPITPEHARLARQAHRNYGRGSGHRARLNFGDCFSYALAIQTGEPLLFKGDDFGHTDVRAAL